MMPEVPNLREGAREFIGLLEATLDRAKYGDLVHGGIVATTAEGAVMSRLSGTPDKQVFTHMGLCMLARSIEDGMQARRPPTRDPSLTADYACFNVVQSPCSYDWIAWLAEKEMRRVAAGAPYPLKIHFHMGFPPDRALAFQYPRREQMFENVIKPSMSFIGAVEDPKAAGATADADSFSFAPIVERVKRGEKIPLFKAMCEVNSNGPKPVTITLRETDSAPGRNSRLEEWVKLAKWLRERGERVIFLRDTDKAEERVEDFELCPIASTNIHARLGVYLDAKCNLFVANGPATLAFFTEVPWLLFHYADPMDEHYPSSPNGWKQYAGISPGEQFPWCNEKQRIIWEEPEFVNMKAAWEEMFPKDADAAAA